jgi:hypothetical protein
MAAEVGRLSATEGAGREFRRERAERGRDFAAPVEAVADHIDQGATDHDAIGMRRHLRHMLAP